MMKKFTVLAIALLAGAFVSANAADASGFASLDVVVRDFEPNHPDFENFSEEYINNADAIYSYGAAHGLVGYDNLDHVWTDGTTYNWYTNAPLHQSCGNKASYAFGYGTPLGTDGLPLFYSPASQLPSYLQATSASTVNGDTANALHYGECSDKVNGKTVRGYQYVVNSGTRGYTCPTPNMNWANLVMYTPEMVSRYLTFVTTKDSLGNDIVTDYNYLNGVTISKANDRCDNAHFDQWFSDVDNVNQRSNMILNIPKDETDAGFYVLDYNYNNGGYFPLDSVNTNNEWQGVKSGTTQWGAQSLSIFCPPYDYQWASSQTDYNGDSTYSLCSAWLANGGPRSTTSAQAAVMSTSYSSLAMQHFRNYNFTMMGHAKFRYYASKNTSEATAEVFEFAGDDDMWIYVDGVLAVDLGGTHLSTPGKVNLYTLAKNNHGCHAGEPLAVINAAGCSDTGWVNGSWHHLHFFYADRQTDGSNLYIRTSLSEIAPTAYGQPRVIHAELKTDETTGELVTYLFVNTLLSDASVALIAGSGNNSAYFPILDIRKIVDVNGIVTGYDTTAYNVTSFAYQENKGSDGYLYKLTGQLCSDVNCTTLSSPNAGDSLAFNYSAAPKFVDGVSTIPESANNKFAYTADWAITSTMNISVDKYNFGPITTISIASTTTIIPADSTIDRPPFNDQLLPDGKLKDNETGEIFINSLPPSYANSANPSQWISDSIAYYTSAPDPSNPNSTSPTTQVVNSSGTTATTSSAKCYSSGGNESCVSFAFVTDEAFRVNIRVFDHLGHFVSQYGQELDTAAFRKMVATTASSCTDNTGDAYGGLSFPGVVSGKVAASVKVYPVSQQGRKLGTGPYIYQVSLIEYPFPHCVNIKGSQSYVSGEYRRTQYTTTRGYRRIISK